MQHFTYWDRKTLIVMAVLFLCGVGLGALMHKETIVVREGTPATEAAMSSVNLMIDYGDGDIKTWNTVSWAEAMSVVGLLERVASVGAIKVGLSAPGNKDTAVNSIDLIENDTEAELRWQYWVNNNYEPRIPERYFLKPGDIVLWKYVKEQPK